MASLVLALHVDRLGAKAALPAPLAAANRVIYVREGDATIRAGGQAATLAANSAWHGAVGCEVAARANGATLLRWELAPVVPSGSKPALSQTIDLADPGGYLMRCDRVDFPPGGIAYTHTHRGPGIRCLLSGEIRIRVSGTEQLVRPGEA